MKKRNPVIFEWMKNPSRARTRHEDKRAKEETKHKLRLWNFSTDDAARLGKWSSTHGRPCSCMLCKKEPMQNKFKGNVGIYLEEEMI
jgi:hypothetical protein